MFNRSGNTVDIKWKSVQALRNFICLHPFIMDLTSYEKLTKSEIRKQVMRLTKRSMDVLNAF